MRSKLSCSVRMAGNVYRRHPSVRLRRTDSGGAAFRPDHSATVDLTAGAFALLCWLGKPHTARQLRQRYIQQFGRNVTLAEVDRLARQLMECAFAGIVDRPPSDDESTLAASHLEPESTPEGPESVHIQLTKVCNLQCPYCYAGPQQQEDDILSLAAWKSVIDGAADMGTFHVAFGGGEPLLSPHFVPLVHHARRHGLLPHVTTNGRLMSAEMAAGIRDAIGEVRLSLEDGISADWPLAEGKASLLRSQEVRFGFNLIVTRHNLAHLEQILHKAVALSPASVTLLRPKPALHNGEWYHANALSAYHSHVLLDLLKRSEPLFTRTQLTVDCALSYLYQDHSEAELTALGVEGCAMGDRFVVVHPNGDVYPCSHLHGKQWKAGDVRRQSLASLWRDSPALHIACAMKDNLEGACGLCIRRRRCGGCRAIVWDTTNSLTAADAGCPEDLKR